MKISACLVTRGDVDLTPILDTLPYDDVVVWDNSERENLAIYGRYAAIAEAKHDVIYVQDDDLLFHDHAALADSYEDGSFVCNYAQPWDIPWVARGALFHRSLPAAAFERYWDRYSNDEYFRRYACDGVFGLLTPSIVLDLPYEDLPWCNDPGRVSTTPGWYDVHRPEIQSRCQQLGGVHGRALA